LEKKKGREKGKGYCVFCIDFERYEGCKNIRKFDVSNKKTPKTIDYE
jgi:hypothetical protein